MNNDVKNGMQTSDHIPGNNPGFLDYELQPAPGSGARILSMFIRNRVFSLSACIRASLIMVIGDW